MVDGIFDVTVSTALAVEIRKDVDRRIGDEDRLGVGRHIHHEDMADAPIGPQPALFGGDGPHELIGMQAALHQHLGLRRVDQFDRSGSCFFAVRHVDELESRYVDGVLGGDARDLVGGPDQDRLDDSGFCGVGGAAQGGFVARMHHDRADRRDLFCRGDETIVF
jgi:hypothetical protein